MAKHYSFLDKEKTASIRDIQLNPSKALKGSTRVTRGGKTMGFYFSNDECEEILEDIAAMASKDLKKRVTEARLQFQSQQAGISLGNISKEYGL